MPEGLLFGDPVEVLFATPVHLIVLLIVLTVAAFRAAPGRGLRRWRWPLAGLAAWAWITATPALAHLAAARLEFAYAPAAIDGVVAEEAVIVVLAGGDGFNEAVPDDRQLNLASLRRTVAAADLWARTGGVLITVGDAFPRGGEPLAARMASLAEDLGVPGSRVRALPQSRNTYENLRSLDRERLRGRRVFLVTSALHMPRAMAVARRLGLDPVPVPCDYRSRPNLSWRAWLPNSGAWPLLGLVLHERLGLLYYRLKGWA